MPVEMSMLADGHIKVLSVFSEPSICVQTSGKVLSDFHLKKYISATGLMIKQDTS